MKKLITLSTLFVVSSLAVAQGGFQDPNAPKAEKPRHEMRHEHHSKKHAEKHGGFFDESKAIKSVADIKAAADNSSVILTGHLVKQIGKNEFMFKDASGEIEVEISKKAWKGQTITPEDRVELRGKLDKEWEKTEVEIKQIVKK